MRTGYYTQSARIVNLNPKSGEIQPQACLVCPTLQQRRRSKGIRHRASRLASRQVRWCAHLLSANTRSPTRLQSAHRRQTTDRFRPQPVPKPRAYQHSQDRAAPSGPSP
jgi:hypothetical protein